MNFINKQNFNVRLSLYISLFLIIVYQLVGYYLLNYQKGFIFNSSVNQIKEKVEGITNIYSLLIEDNQQKVNNSLNYAVLFFQTLGNLKENDSLKTEIETINQFTKNQNKSLVNRWLLNDSLLQGNNKIVDQIKKVNQIDASIFQKTSEGYVRISTTLTNEFGDRALGATIPFSSPIIETIERGLSFKGMNQLLSDWYLTAYNPIYINGKISGMLCVELKESSLKKLKQAFLGRYFDLYESFFLINNEGKLVIHNSREGENIKNSQFFQQFIPTIGKIGSFSYHLNQSHLFEESTDFNNTESLISSGIFVNESEIGWNYLFYKFDSSTGNYICLTFNEKPLLHQLNLFRINLIISGTITILLLILIIYFLTKSLTVNIGEVIRTLAFMAKGELVDEIKYNRNDEVGKIANSINVLINGIKRTSEFSAEIGKGNIDASFKPLSENDVLSNSLLKMREDIKKAQEERANRILNDELQHWISDGLAKFDEILRQNSNDLERLSRSIITNLIQYLGANQGGLFLINNSDKENIYLELKSSYAYDRERKLKKEIPLNVGLIGRCMQEKKMLYFTEIPSDYITITSGLGQANPKSLLISPLITGDKVLGVVEIASFELFNRNKLYFVEKLSENISITIASSIMNARTVELLKKSQQQSEELASQEEEMRQNLEELLSTQEAFAHRENEMRGILNAINNATLTLELNTSGEISNINDRFLDLIGIERIQIIGKKYETLLAEDSRKEYQSLKEKLNTGDIVSVVSHLSYFGKDLWLSETFTPVTDDEGEVYKIIDIAIDISNAIENENQLNIKNTRFEEIESELRKNKEKSLAYQKEAILNDTQNKKIIQALEESFLISETTISGTYLKVNKQFSELIGIEESKLIGSFHREYYKMAETQRNYRVFWRDLKNGIIKTIKHQLKNIENKEITVAETYIPLVNANNETFKILIIGNLLHEL